MTERIGRIALQRSCYVMPENASPYLADPDPQICIPPDRLGAGHSIEAADQFGEEARRVARDVN
jgi:hypothetical protein